MSIKSDYRRAGRPVCPHCGSVNIRQRVAHWRCECCQALFAKPVLAGNKPVARGKSGVIAPLSYLHQMARDALLKQAGIRTAAELVRRIADG